MSLQFPIGGYINVCYWPAVINPKYHQDLAQIKYFNRPKTDNQISTNNHNHSLKQIPTPNRTPTMGLTSTQTSILFGYLYFAALVDIILTYLRAKKLIAFPWLARPETDVSYLYTSKHGVIALVCLHAALTAQGIMAQNDMVDAMAAACTIFVVGQIGTIMFVAGLAVGIGYMHLVSTGQLDNRVLVTGREMLVAAQGELEGPVKEFWDRVNELYHCGSCWSF